MAKEACLLLKAFSRHAHSFPVDIPLAFKWYPAQTKAPSACWSAAR